MDDSDNTNWILSAKGQNVTIPAGKEDNSKVTIKVGTTNIKEVSDLSTLYGQTTDYTSVSDVQWQIFYDDETTIYLIASDYVSGNLLPNELLNSGNATKTYCKKFVTGSSDTTSPILVGEPWKNASLSSTVQNNPYLKWVGSAVDTVRTNINMKSVAYMMDTNKWSNFAGKANGAYAIGGPTIEMFVLSYNAKHNTGKLGTYGTNKIDITTANANSNGYKVKGAEGWRDYVKLSDTTNAAGDTDGNMWVRTSSTKASGYWLASPSSYNNVTVNRITYTGYIDCNYFSSVDSIGFRPLVAIPKSSLK